jgi:transcriptional regulator GlxA family with amidase domain
MSEFDSNVQKSDPSYSTSSETAVTKCNIVQAQATPLEDARIRKLLLLIESDPLGKSQDWALTLNLSNSHLQRLFKEATGVALGQALAEKRLQKAASLLATTNLRIKEIAYAVGYEHTSSFTRAFERRFAQAPRHFRMTNAA